MKNEVGTPVIIAIIVVLVVVIGGIAWSMFGKKGGGHSDAEEKYMQQHGPTSGGAGSPGSGGSPNRGGSPMSGSPSR